MKERKNLHLLQAVLLVALLVILDQVTKLIAVTHLSYGRDIDIIKNVLQLHYLRNTGAAFSLLEQKMTFFYIITPVLLCIILFFFLQLPKLKQPMPLWFVCVGLWAGAIGNYIDRIRYQYVIDFIYFSLINFPVFNVADIYVTLSVVALILLILFFYKEEELDQLFPKKKNKQ